MPYQMYVLNYRIQFITYPRKLFGNSASVRMYEPAAGFDSHWVIFGLTDTEYKDSFINHMNVIIISMG